MKKTLALALALVCAMSVFAGCSKKDEANTLKDDKTLTDVVAAIDAKFVETYGADFSAVPMGMPIDETYLVDMCAIDMETIEEFVGNVAMTMVRNDTLIAVKAKEGSADAIKLAFEKRKTDLVAQYETYPVGGSLERAQNAEIYQKGNYVFFLAIGGNDDTALDFAKDLDLAKTTIDSMFN